MLMYLIVIYVYHSVNLIGEFETKIPGNALLLVRILERTSNVIMIHMRFSNPLRKVET